MPISGPADGLGARPSGPPIDPRFRRLVERELQERRFSALVAAVRDHKARAGAHLIGERPHDRALYRRLREISSGR